MFRRNLLTKGSDHKGLLMASILLANTFIWYYMARAAIQTTATGQATTLGAYYSAIVVSSLLGVMLSRKLKRSHILYCWVALGSVASALPMLLGASETGVLITSIILGISFGIGMPSCLAFLGDSTTFENRGTTGGLIFLATNVGALGLLIPLGNIVETIFLVSFFWRISCLPILFLLKLHDVKHVEADHRPFRQIFASRPLRLYMLSWLMFCLIDRFERIYCEVFFEPSFFQFLNFVEPLVGTIFAVAAGYAADRIGRKHVVISGFIALGIAYAGIGLASDMVVSRYFYTIIDGAAWGIFTVTFILVLWGDIASNRGAREEYYAIGSIPFFLADIIALIFRPYLREIPTQSADAIFSLASFFLFLAVLPLMFAPETLPGRRLRRRRLKTYAEKAAEMKEKFDGKH